MTWKWELNQQLYASVIQLRSGLLGLGLQALVVLLSVDLMLN
jgi:hypothetical protein